MPWSWQLARRDRKRKRRDPVVELTVEYAVPDIRDFVLMVERHRTDAVLFQRKSDVGLRLDRVHVEHLGLGRDGANRSELAWRSDVEALDAGGGQRLQHHRLAVGLHRIRGAARERRDERARVLGQHARAKAIDRHVGAERHGGVARGLETRGRPLEELVEGQQMR